MKKPLIFLVIFGALVSGGIVISFYSAKQSLEEVSMEEIKLEPGETIEINKNLEPSKSESGVVAVQLDNYESETVDAKVLDPFGSQLTSDTLMEESYQQDFTIDIDGNYKLVMRNFGQSEASGIIAIGYLPNESSQLLAYGGMVIILIGLIGLIGTGIYTIKNRRKEKF